MQEIILIKIKNQEELTAVVDKIENKTKYKYFDGIPYFDGEYTLVGLSTTLYITEFNKDYIKDNKHISYLDFMKLNDFKLIPF